VSVVIDEFEVLANEDEGTRPIASPAVTSNAASSPTVHDLERVVERQGERYERVRAN
jgi:hypothetical protein